MSRAQLLDQETLARRRPYPERADAPEPWYDALALQAHRRMWLPLARRVARVRQAPVADVAESHADRLRLLDDTALKEAAQALRGRLRHEDWTPALVAECFAVVAEASERTVGQRHRPCQFTAGWLLLQGRLVEMATGEGKTIAATLPATVAAWSGLPVHVITVNDYLAQRDADDLRPLYALLGLSVGVVVQGMQRADRRAAYARSITYCCNKELAFDYLRDRVATAGHGSRLHMAFGQLQGRKQSNDALPVMRGLVFGIVDEADSVFIDEARTPLILASSAPSAGERDDLEHALAVAASLVQDQDFRVERHERNVLLLDQGLSKLGAQTDAGGLWASARAGAEMVTQALRAMHVYLRDRDYVVVDGKVQIVDESTGRVMPDRSWEHGLHQMIEVKEGCVTSDRRQTLARLTYQRLFRRYLRLAGMTGTAAEVAGEVKAVYALDVKRVPLHRPMIRRRMPNLICRTAEEKWTAVADAVAAVAMRDRRPVLIGTRSVKASEEISARLAERAIPHALLNAKQDKDEAEVIAAAGQPGRVTVATNMAGRGTDIKLGSGVAERGGLHVILTEFHESRRIDRQLFGRCARQGDPGSCQAIVALDDELYRINVPAATRLVAGMAGGQTWRARVFARGLTVLAQAVAERRNAFARTQTLKADQRLEKTLAFSGRGQ